MAGGGDRFPNLTLGQKAILLQAEQDEENREVDQNASMGIIVFGVAYALEFALPSPNLENSPTFHPSEKKAWELCIGVSGGCFPTLICINLCIWFFKSLKKHVPQINRHIKNLLRYTTIVIAINTIVRGVLMRLKVYNWVYVGCTPFVLFISYFLAIKLKDAVFGHVIPEPRNLKILAALQQAGLEDALEAPAPAPQPGFCHGIRAACKRLFGCLVRMVDVLDRF